MSYAPAVEQVKVSERTRELVRLGSTLNRCTQGEFVDKAVAEFLSTHRDEVEAGLQHAREVLLVDRP